MPPKNKTRSSSQLNMTNKFFIENTIQPMSRLLSSSGSHHQSARDRNYVSVGNNRQIQSSEMYRTERTNTFNPNQTQTQNQSQSKMKLNPKQFQHRQVFNTKLYHQNPSSTQTNTMKKFFKIQITKQQRQQSKLGDEVGQYLAQITKHFQKIDHHNNQTLKQQWKAVQHHVTLIQSHVSMLAKSEPIKIMLTTLFAVIETFLISFSGLLTSSAQTIKNQSFEILAQTSSKFGLVNESKYSTKAEMSKKLNGSSSANKLNWQVNQQQQPNSDSKQQSIFNLTMQITKQKSKISQLQFQTKKQYLKIQSLLQQLNDKNVLIEVLREQNANMRKQIAAIDVVKEEYEYKIRKFKEELEVAHIVKQQNLEDKVNYILGWKL